MYKVIIIDDEEPVREAIKILGKWEELHIKEIIEALNGKEGIELVRQKKPDIVIVDMKMPEMDGMTFLKILEEEHPEIQSIVLSGYNSFEYTRQAIKSKVADYLLKPVNKDELNSALSKCINNISKKREEQHIRIENNIMLNMTIPVLKERIFISIIDGKFHKDEMDLYLKVIENEEKKKCFGVAIFMIMNMKELMNNKFGNNVNLMHSAIVNIINEICSEDVDCFSFPNPSIDKQIIIIFSYDNVLKKDTESLYHSIIKKVILKVRELLKIKAVVCMGKNYSGIEKINDSYKSAQTVLNSINVIDMKEGIYNEVIKNDKQENTSILNSMVLLKGAFEKGGIGYVKSIISEHLYRLEENGYLSFSDACRIIKEFIIIMDDLSSSLGITNNYSFDTDRKNSNEMCYNFSTFKEFEDMLYNIVDVYYMETRDCIKVNENFKVAKIKEYIDKSYSEDIKISMFTDKYYLSREYIMKLFKKEYGCGIHEYVQNVRMIKAKELLNDVNIKIKDISQILGYSDTNYFSKAFKNYYGISPTEYRETN